VSGLPGAGAPVSGAGVVRVGVPSGGITGGMDGVTGGMTGGGVTGEMTGGGVDRVGVERVGMAGATGGTGALVSGPAGVATFGGHSVTRISRAFPGFAGPIIPRVSMSSRSSLASVGEMPSSFERPFNVALFPARRNATAWSSSGVELVSTATGPASDAGVGAGETSGAGAVGGATTSGAGFGEAPSGPGGMAILPNFFLAGSAPGGFGISSGRGSGLIGFQLMLLSLQCVFDDEYRLQWRGRFSDGFVQAVFLPLGIRL